MNANCLDFALLMYTMREVLRYMEIKDMEMGLRQ